MRCNFAYEMKAEWGGTHLAILNKDRMNNTFAYFFSFYFYFKR